MLRSMTGFGAARGVAGDTALSLSVRAVNHKHLQVKARLGSDLAALEAEVDKRVRARLTRGAVSVTLDRERAPGATPAVLDRDLARSYGEALRGLAQELGLKDGPDLRTLVGLPGVLAAPARGAEADALGPAVLATLDEALDALVGMRGVEGRALEADLRTNLVALRALAGKIADRAPEIVREHHATLTARVSELVGEAGVAPADLAREVAVLADKLDVSEELSRLDSHLGQFDALLAAAAAEGSEGVGRKLDFLCQELFREINTVGSKCSDATVAHWVVDAKTHAERLREQVQNVE